ncbi:MAG: N-acetyltransferase [Actinomycetota bacterium]|nr:N-acetyltransferase [Actinomycetota bacterium]
MTEIQVEDNPAKRRFEALAGGEVAGYVFYQQREDALILIHTEVAEEFEGKGVGSRLAAGTLDDIRARGLRIVPVCPFIKSYIERHPEYADLVAA